MGPAGSAPASHFKKLPTRVPPCWAGTDPSVPFYFFFLALTLCPVKVAVLAPDLCVLWCRDWAHKLWLTNSEYLVSEK